LTRGGAGGGGRYAYRGGRGGRYAYRGGYGYYGGYRRYQYYDSGLPYGYYGYNVPYLTDGYYGGRCDWYYRNAIATDSSYWWDRFYEKCIGYY
jgi:hypothetical protein